VAILGSLLAHVPPLLASARDVVDPTHALKAPVIGFIAFIVTTVVA
jgi:hypothetical protein